MALIGETYICSIEKKVLVSTFIVNQREKAFDYHVKIQLTLVSSDSGDSIGMHGF